MLVAAAPLRDTVLLFSRSVVSNSLRPHGLQPTRLSCPSPSPGVYSNSSPFSWWCHPTISSSDVPFSFYLQSFQHQGLLKWVALCIRWPKYWSLSFSIHPSTEYSGLTSFRIEWFDLLAVQGTLESSPTPQFKTITSLVLSLFYGPALTSVHDYWKNHSFYRTYLCRQCNSLFFNTLSRFVIAFLTRLGGKCLLISCLQSSHKILGSWFWSPRK